MSITSTPANVTVKTRTENAHVTILGDDEEPASIDIGQSGTFRGVWVTTKALNIPTWKMVKSAILVTPEEAEALGRALIAAAKAARTVTSLSGHVFDVETL
jgi:hypothetical protein